MGTELRIYQSKVEYDFERDIQNVLLEQVGETIHDINTVELILKKKEWGIEGEGGAVAEVQGQDIILILMADENKYSVNNIEEDEVYRVEVSY